MTYSDKVYIHISLYFTLYDMITSIILIVLQRGQMSRQAKRDYFYVMARRPMLHQGKLD